MPDFNEKYGDEVDEQERVHHAHGELHDVKVLEAPPLVVRADPHGEEEPEGEGEHEEEKGDERAVEVDPRHGGLRVTEENSPRTQEQ